MFRENSILPWEIKFPISQKKNEKKRQPQNKIRISDYCYGNRRHGIIISFPDEHIGRSQQKMEQKTRQWHFN